MARAWKKSHVILSDRLDFYMIYKLSLAGHAFARHILTSLSVDEILQPRYVNLSTNFRGLSFRVQIASSHLKHMHSILFVLTWRPVPTAVCSRFCSRNSTCAGVFARSAISFA